MDSKELELLVEVLKNNSKSNEILQEVIVQSGKDTPRFKTIRMAMICITILGSLILLTFMGYLIVDSNNMKALIASQKELSNKIDNMEVIVNTDAIAVNGETDSESLKEVFGEGTEHELIGNENNNK